nr:retrovirus-related Pol polyprotein from transposon TNT 1-94 [Tanacetum cinerariifolium]
RVDTVRNKNVNTARRKALLNAVKGQSTKGHTQEQDIDYDEVFAPVTRIEAIKLFLTYASFKNFVVYQIDMNSAFLYGKIKEECKKQTMVANSITEAEYVVALSCCGQVLWIQNQLLDYRHKLTAASFKLMLLA